MPTPLENTALINTKLNETLASFNNLFQSDITKLRHAIPPNQIWRFFINGKRQQEGWLKFESTEPGYLMAMTKAFQKIFAPTTDIEALAIQLHIIAANVKNLLYDKFPGESINTYRKNNIYLPGIVRSNCTSDGIIELISTILNYPKQTDYPELSLVDKEDKCGIVLNYIIPPRFTFQSKSTDLSAPTPTTDKKENNSSIDEAKNTLPNSPDNTSSVFYKLIKYNLITDVAIDAIPYFMSYVNQYLDDPYKKLQLAHVYGNSINLDEKVAEAMSLRMKSYINEYVQSILAATNPYEKLKAIVYFIRNCERLHPFVDANTRTFSMLLLNHLLIQNGFIPVIRNDPNMCYAITIEEFIDDIIDGMNRTLNLAQGNEPYNIKTTDIIAKLSTVELELFSQTIAIETNSRIPSSSIEEKEGKLTILPAAKIQDTSIDLKTDKALLSVNSISISLVNDKKDEDDLLSLEELKKLRDKRIVQTFKNKTKLDTLGILTPHNIREVTSFLFSTDAKLEFISMCEPYYKNISYGDLKTMLTGQSVEDRVIILSKWMEAQDKATLPETFKNFPKAKSEILAIMKLSQSKSETITQHSIFKIKEKKPKEECISNEFIIMPTR